MAVGDPNASIARGKVSNRRGSHLVSPVWEEKVTALEDAFRALPTGPFEPILGIPPQFLISGIGRQLMLMRPVAVHKTHTPAKKSLSKVAGMAASLTDALDSLPQEAIEAINFNWSKIGTLRLQLRVLHLGAKTAKPNVVRGAPKKGQPRVIAEVVATHYWVITGKKPTVPKKAGVSYGPFLKLLKTVFEILEIRASAQSQAEAVSRTWNSTLQKLLVTSYGNK